MSEHDVEPTDELLDYARRTTKALETLVYITKVMIFLGVLGGIVGLIAYFGS